VATKFAKLLAELLEAGRTPQRYSKLVLIAVPRFLGNLHAGPTAPTKALGAATIDKDLGSIEARHLPRHARDVLRTYPPVVRRR
jgi:protein required for attachment to host cells